MKEELTKGPGAGGPPPGMGEAPEGMGNPLGTAPVKKLMLK